MTENMSASVQVRMSPDFRKRIERCARRHGYTLATFMRVAAVQMVERLDGKETFPTAPPRPDPSEDPIVDD